jgi:hypothetical protein
MSTPRLDSAANVLADPTAYAIISAIWSLMSARAGIRSGQR